MALGIILHSVLTKQGHLEEFGLQSGSTYTYIVMSRASMSKLKKKIDIKAVKREMVPV